MRRVVLLLALLTLLFVTSCDQVESLLSLLPVFDTNLPVLFVGKYAEFESEGDKQNGYYDRLYVFDSEAMTYTFSQSDAEGTEEGSYRVEYINFLVTQANGYLYLTPSGGRERAIPFVFYSTSTGGPEYIELGDYTYYYWGK